jgi:predicted MFS family arabinose efflux permease
MPTGVLSFSKRYRILQTNTEENPGKLFVPALIIATFAVSLSIPMLSVVTADIALTFMGTADQTALGLAAQVNTVNRAAEVVFALAMGFLTIKLKSRSLLLIGTVFLLTSAIGGFFAPTLPLLQLFYILEGGGTVIIGITAFSLIGDLLTAEKKPKVISYMNAVSFAALLVATPVIGIITNVGGWRLNYLWLVLPLSIAGLVLAYMGLPARKIEKNIPQKPSYLSGFKEIFKSRSAVFCLVAGMCNAAGNFGILAIAYYRQHFLSEMPMDYQVNFASAIFMAASAIIVASSLVTGRLIQRVGCITLTVIGTAGNAVFAALLFFMPNLWSTVAINMIHVWFFGMAVTPWSCLALDQVPAFRGTMMSLRSIFLSAGYSLTTAVGGAALVLFGSYQASGIALALVVLPSAPIIYFLVKDPNKTQQLESRKCV